MNAPLEDPKPALNGTSSPAVSAASVQAAGAVYNYQPRPVALSVGSEALITVDPESNITFGDNMEKAIKQVLAEPEPETGKAP
jgi:hypothetical protein